MTRKLNQPSGTVGVSIVEDDDDIRANLVTLISRAHGFCIVTQHENAEEAIREIPRAAPDVVLMDINLPGITGIQCVGRIRALLPQVQILMLTIYEDSDQIFQSLRAGANGSGLSTQGRRTMFYAYNAATFGEFGSNSVGAIRGKLSDAGRYAQGLDRDGDGALGEAEQNRAAHGDASGMRGAAMLWP